MRILIVGAGIGGLGAAIALAKAGFEVSVFEQAIGLEDVGAGIQLSPNAMHVLDAYGLCDVLEQVGFQPETGVLRDWKSGKVLTETQFGKHAEKRYGQKYLHVHRADLIKVLYEKATQLGADFTFGSELTSLHQTEQNVSITMKSGLPYDGDLLIGADGLKSRVQRILLGKNSPRFTGQVAWRATVPVDDLPPRCVAPKATVWRGPNKHLVTYLLRSGTLANIVAVEERDDFSSESWKQAGDPKELRSAFEGWHPDVETLVGAVKETKLWALYDRLPLDTWSIGRAVLLGDACHPMLPFMAQGGAMAIEDGYVLAKCLKGEPDVDSALQTYETIRKPRTTMLQKKSKENTGLFHMHGGLQAPINAAKLVAGGLFPSLALKTLDSVYGVDVTK